MEPDGAHRALYDELYETYGELYPAVRTQLHRLAAVQEAAGSQGPAGVTPPPG